MVTAAPPTVIVSPTRSSRAGGVVPSWTTLTSARASGTGSPKRMSTPDSSNAGVSGPIRVTVACQTGFWVVIDPSLHGLVDEEAGEVGDCYGDRRGDLSGEQHCRNTDSDGLRLRFAQRQADRHEVAANLT